MTTGFAGSGTRALAVCVILAGVGCAPQPPAPWDGPVLAEPRTQLTVDQLFGEERPPLLDMSFLARPDWADGEAEPFEGVLTLADTGLWMDYPASRDLYPGEDRFPEVRIEMLSHEGALIPRDRGRILRGENSESQWDVLVGTGAVWREPGDVDYSRASFPLGLVDRFFNQVRNCVGTFVYRGEDVSRTYVQCSQETADLNDQQVGNLSAWVHGDYEPTAFADAPQVLEAHAVRVAGRIPTRPLLGWDTDGEVSAYFSKTLWTNASTSAGAVYADGTLYVHPAMTRHGPHPYPNEMRHGVFSVTKSLAGALAMFFFAEKYGDEVFDARVTDHVPAFADLPEWQGVTFSDALNMATGTHGGESADLLYEPLILADTAEEAIHNIAAFGDAPARPGEVFSYATTNTFVLSVALQHFVEEREGSGVQYWDLVRDEVLVPIGAGDLEVLRTRDADPSARIPLLGFGARPTLDQATKIARLIANEGVHEGQQLLHGGRIREALGRTAWDGLRIDGTTRYRHSFWSRSVRTRGLSRGGSGLNTCRAEVSFMQGYGANHVLILPSGVVVLRFMDENDEDIEDLVQRVERVSPSCDES